MVVAKCCGRAVLFGLVCGLVMLSILGAVVRPQHFIDGYERFHIGLNHRQFFPTGRELEAILDRLPPDKIVVVVGGTSVFQGMGQTGDLIWSKALQRDLGDRFVVINFGLGAGRPNELGNFVAEMLLKRGRKTIYLCDAMTGDFTLKLEDSRFQPIAFDVWRRGYLLPWAPRDKIMNAALWDRDPATRESAWGSLLDLGLNFRDLWNTFTYEVIGTVWNSTYTTQSFLPLKRVVDPEPPPGVHRAMAYPKAKETELLGITARQIPPFDDPSWANIRANIVAQFPTDLRLHMLVNVDLNSPHYVDQLPDGPANFLAHAHFMAWLLETLGIRATSIVQQGFGSDDYVDRAHASVEGGAKIAARLAPKVDEVARSLGYMP